MTITNNDVVTGDKLFQVKIVSAKPSNYGDISKPRVGSQSITTIVVRDDDG